ncbi:MAG: VWA domain-containing protein, partial [Anaerolineae bacterium]|jgi:Ca-activated chloride channel family protein
VGLQAAPVSEQDIHPNNIALVLDKSGSMAEADKMSFLKQSLHIFVDELDTEDLIAIVVYDNDARVLLPAQTVGDGQQVRAAIDQLSPGGATNLHGGLMLGYAEVEKYYAPNLNNRVILLTDGIANRGETEPDEIAADSLAYNEKGIFLSTIGLGLDFNDALLSTLAEQGKGNYHFINDAQEMERVFKQEATGLVQTVATNVWLTLGLADGVQVQRVYGYDYELEGNTMRVQFDDAGAESSQILVLNMVVAAGQGAEQILARATLEHDDVFAEAHDVQQSDVIFSYGAPVPYDPLVLPAVRRNVTILQMAEALQQVSFLCDQRKYQQALSLIQEVKAEVWKIATEEGDAQMQEDVELLDNYEVILQKLVELASRPASSSTEREPEPSGGLCGPTPLMGLGAMALAFAGRRRKL